MATVNEGSLIDFCDETSIPPPKKVADENSSEENSPEQEKVEISRSGAVADTTANTTTIDALSPAESHAKLRNISQADYDSGVEDDNQHGKKTLSPDTPSPAAHSPPLQEKEKEKQTGKAVDSKIKNTKPEQQANARPKTSGSAHKPTAQKCASEATRPKTASTTTTRAANANGTTTKKTAAKENISATTKPGLKNVQSKVGSLDYAAHKPGGGNVKIENRKLNFSAAAKSKIGANENLSFAPGGGDKKIESRKLEWKAESKIGSLHNAYHKPAGGDVKVVTQKLTWKAESKIGSMDNTKHKPGGGNVKITEQKTDFSKVAKSKIGSLENATHKAGGGIVKIKGEKVDFSKVAKSKIGSLENAGHQPGGGNVKIVNEKLKIDATSKIGSLPVSAPLSERSSSPPVQEDQQE